MKQGRMVGTRLPSELVRDLERIERAEQADRSTTLRKLVACGIESWKLEHYAHQYSACKMTLERAAKNAGVSMWELQEYLRAKRLPVQYDEADLAHDLKVLGE